MAGGSREQREDRVARLLRKAWERSLDVLAEAAVAVAERHLRGSGKRAGLGLGQNVNEGGGLATILLRLDRSRAVAALLGDGKLVERVAPSVRHVDQHGVRPQEQATPGLV